MTEKLSGELRQLLSAGRFPDEGPAPSRGDTWWAAAFHRRVVPASIQLTTERRPVVGSSFSQAGHPSERPALGAEETH